jgi:hypothetical protein
LITNDDPLAKLDALLEGGALPDDDESGCVNGIPPTSVITMTTFNHYDNGPQVRKKWMSTQFKAKSQTWSLTPEEKAQFVFGIDAGDPITAQVKLAGENFIPDNEHLYLKHLGGSRG